MFASLLLISSSQIHYQVLAFPPWCYLPVSFHLFLLILFIVIKENVFFFPLFRFSTPQHYHQNDMAEKMYSKEAS